MQNRYASAEFQHVLFMGLRVNARCKDWSNTQYIPKFDWLAVFVGVTRGPLVVLVKLRRI